MISSSQIPPLVLSAGPAVGLSSLVVTGTGGTASPRGRQLPLGLQGYSLCEKRWVMGVPG